MTPESLLLCLISAPSREAAETIARTLLEKKLAACVHLGPSGSSLYWWNGVLEESSEIPLTIKTIAAKRDEIEIAVAEVHPYQVPEIIFISGVDAEAKYLQWVQCETGNRTIS